MTAAQYGSALMPQHAELLAASAIAPDVAHARGYRSVDTAATLASVKIAKKRRAVPGLLIPVHGVDGTVRLHQYRPDRPAVDGNGDSRKYETPYRARMVLDVPPPARDRIGDPTVPLWVTEGARKADAAVSAGLCCVALLGVWNWRGTNELGGRTVLSCWDSVALNDRRVYVCFDSDVMTKESVGQALDGLARFLASRGATVKLVYLPDGDNGEKAGLDDYLAAGHTVDELHALARDAAKREQHDAKVDPPPPPPKRSTLTDTVHVFRRWLYLDDPAPLYAVAAALVANRAPGDPVWLLLVAAPATGKTEIVGAAARLPWVIPAAKVTEAALLSGTSRKDRAKDATGGLLRQVGDFGVLLVKDFTSVLAQNKDARSEALAALREVYDGSWHRPTGAEGGRVLTWRGKCGIVGGVTPALDQYAQVTSQLGDRFLLLRLPDADVDQVGDAALGHNDDTAMRAELAAALGGLVEHADLARVDRAFTADEKRRLIRLAAYTARTRTAVARDGYKQEIQYLPQVEGPGRLVKAYARLAGGLEAIGCDPSTAWTVLARVAVDCAPATRTALIRDLIDRDQPTRTSTIATSVGVATKTAARYLEDLSLLGVVDRDKESKASNAPDLWRASTWLVEHWPESETDNYPPSPNPPREGGQRPTADR